MIKDHYVQENGTLKNRLNITDYNELNDAERDIGYVKLLNAEKVMQPECDAELLKKIHKHIFGDIFDWAGEYRDVPLYKEEVVIPGLSLSYSQPENIDEELNQRLKELNACDFNGKKLEEISKQFTLHLAKIWRVHPFRDGNTRTTLTFANVFAKQHGFELDMSTMLDNLGRRYDSNGRITRYSLRDKFVLAALDDKDYPEPEHLELVIRQAIKNGITKKMDSYSDIMEK